MLRTFSLLLVNLLFATDVTIGQYCSSTRDAFQAYSLGRNVFVGQGASAIWRFNSDINQVVDQKFSLNEVYGENSFEWVDTVFGFPFEECGSEESQAYCEAIDKARNIVIAIGQKKQETGSRKYGYLAYSMDPNGLLSRVNHTNIVWDLSTSGTLTGNFWVSLPGDLYYESSVFVVSRNELYVSVYDTSSNSDSKYHLMSRKLEKSGEWAKNWVEISKLGFRGMFDVNGRVFGMNKKNIVYEFNWSEANVTFNKISQMKELLNCFGNSSLDEMPTNAPQVMTTNASEVMATNASEVMATNASEVMATIASQVDANGTEAITSLTETVTMPQEMITSTETLTTTQSPIAEETKEEEKPLIWAFISVIGLILLLTIIVLGLIMIYRRKTKSQIIYLNANPSQSKKNNSNTTTKTFRSKQF